jgi:methionyl-tRNA formyltransferase
MKILFWGTPDFGVPSLRALQEEGHAVVAVVTQPDRPAGRGRALRPGPIKAVAQEEGIPVLQPEKPRGEEFLAQLRELEPELSVVAAYGEILTDDVLSLPSRGSVNVHASLLPELRGAAPVNWAIIRGHEHSGITIMRMVRELDAGPVLYRVAVELAPDLTAGELYEMLSEIGAAAVVEALAQMEAGSLGEEPQVHEHATYAPKMSREGARLDWRLPPVELDRWIRGCDPWPGAWTTLEDRPVQVFGPELNPSAEDGSPLGAGPPGTVLAANAKQGLVVATGSGAIRLREVKPAGRPRMSSEAWIHGRSVAEGQSFE